MRTLLTSIRTRLVVTLIAFTLLPTALISLIFISTSVRYAEQKAQDTLNAVATLKENQIKSWATDLNKDLAVEVERDADIPWMHTMVTMDPSSAVFKTAHAAQLKIFQGLISSRGVFEDLTLLNSNGVVVFSTHASDEGANFASQDYFKNALLSPYLAAPGYDPSLGKISMMAATPLLSDQGQVIGVLAGRANMATLNTLLKENTGIGVTGETYLVGANSVLLTEASNPTIYVVGYNQIHSLGIENAYQNHQSGLGSYTNYQGLPVFGAFRWIPELRAGLIAEQQQGEALKNLTTARNSVAVAVILSALIAIGAAFYLGRNLTQPLIELTETAEKIAGGDLAFRASTERKDEIGQLAVAFNSMTAQLRNLIENLEERVASRTKQLHSRSEQLMAASEVGRSVTTILDMNELIQQVVDLIRQRFDLYYVGLFQVDENREWAVLKAGTGEAGKHMLGRGHRLKLGEGSMIGWSIANAQARIALEAGEDPVRLATSELPNTRSEAAIPLRSRGQILGAISVQSTQPGAFDRETIAVFQTMADQVAVALDNARLFNETQRSLETVQRAYGELSHQAWLKRLRTRPLILRRDSVGVSQSLASSVEDSETSLAIPIKVRGRTIGVVKAQKRPDSTNANPKRTAWSPEEVNLMENLTDQLGVALESARLYEEASRRAERERLTGEITAKVRATNDPQTILQTAARELRLALQANRTQLILQTTQVNPIEELQPAGLNGALQDGAVNPEPPSPFWDGPDGNGSDRAPGS